MVKAGTGAGNGKRHRWSRGVLASLVHNGWRSQWCVLNEIVAFLMLASKYAR